MRDILHDSELQSIFDEKGYVIVPFLDESQIKILREKYLADEHDLGQGFHATMHSGLVDYRRTVSSYIQEIFNPIADKYLKDYTPLVSNYTVKEIGEDSFFDFHLDWSMVNERVHRSITIWCPLEDVNEVNGHLWVLEGSHKAGFTMRGGPGLFLYFDGPAEEFLGQRFQKKALSLKAGEAVIYDHRLFHGSPPNKSSKVRIAINQAMMPKEAVSWHYHDRGDGKFEILEVDADFYNCYIIGTEVEKSLVKGTVESEHSFLLQKEVNNIIAEPDEVSQRIIN